jgi:DNA-binding CsgD family transcriptional regulator
MALWQKLKEVKDINGGADVLKEVKTLADEQGCGEDEMILKLLDQALRTNHHSERTRRCWESLSYREKQVAALVCSGLTGRQTAAHLVLSPETVKTHVRHILRKFGLNSRRDLRNRLSDWDLSRWLAPENALMIADSYTNYHATARRELCSANVVYDDGK